MVCCVLEEYSACSIQRLAKKQAIIAIRRKCSFYTPILALPFLICFFLLQQHHHLIRDLLKKSPVSSSIPAPPISSIPSNVDGLTIPIVLALHYKSRYDAKLVLHNCLAAKSVNVRMVVYTEFMSDKYCDVCACVKFAKTNCPRPRPGKPNHCEKMHWMSEAIEEYRELIFLDSDLIIMHPREFFYGMASRALSTDFLATYAETTAAKPSKYLVDFNSGMMFIRHIATANYTDLVPRMYRYHTGMDQYILTLFIHENYGMRWDTLSWKWHCRSIIRLQNDVNPAHCITIHDRGEYRVLLKLLNRTLLS